ncbi:MAG: hypothetical protein ACR2IJ_05995 [Fluviibacter sp.]
MSYIGGAGALILETQSSTGSWMNGLSSTSDPTLGIVVGLASSMVPTTDNAYDIGTAVKRLRVLHVTKINNAAAGETLEIGNYTADTGVTGVYGQLQGKGGSWKLYTSSGEGVLGGLTRVRIIAPELTINTNGFEWAGPGSFWASSGSGTAHMDFGGGLVLGSTDGNNGWIGLDPNGVSQYISADSAKSLIVQAGRTTIKCNNASLPAIVAAAAGLYVADASSINPLALLSSSSASSITAARPLTITGTTTTLTSSSGIININPTTDTYLTSGASNYVYVKNTLGLRVTDTTGTYALTAVAGSSAATFTSSTGLNYACSGAMAFQPGGAFFVQSGTMYLGHAQLTPATYISYGGGSTTATTTTIGCNTAGVTNTINIGQIAANDVTNLLGVMMRSPEFVKVSLASDYQYTGTGTQSIPSMTAVTTAGRYLTWNDTNHRFQNSHSTKALTVIITMTTSWTAAAGFRYYWVNNSGDSSNNGYVEWAAGDAGQRTSTCMVVIAASGYAQPQFNTALANDTLRGSASAASSRLTFSAVVI